MAIVKLIIKVIGWTIFIWGLIGLSTGLFWGVPLLIEHFPNVPTCWILLLSMGFHLGCIFLGGWLKDKR